MGRIRMHANEVVTDAALVRRLLAAQFPHWAALPLRPVDSYGTDHDIYRLGSEMCVRLPRIDWATGQAAKEQRLLPLLAPHLPLAVPQPLALGQPADGYPFGWAVYQWLPGSSAEDDLDDLDRAAVDLAAFLTALRGIDTGGRRRDGSGGRGGSLSHMDEQIRTAIAQSGDLIDTAAALRSWEESLGAAGWDGPDVWVHGDLLPGNLLAIDGRLSAVIDFGTLGVGDPACDLIPAWTLFHGTSRARFREALGGEALGGVDEASWLRGRGWALRLVVSLPYYRHTNPGMIRLARHTLTQVLAG